MSTKNGKDAYGRESIDKLDKKEAGSRVRFAPQPQELSADEDDYEITISKGGRTVSVDKPPAAKQPPALKPMSSRSSVDSDRISVSPTSPTSLSTPGDEEEGRNSSKTGLKRWAGIASTIKLQNVLKTATDSKKKKEDKPAYDPFKFLNEDKTRASETNNLIQQRRKEKEKEEAKRKTIEDKSEGSSLLNLFRPARSNSHEKEKRDREGSTISTASTEKRRDSMASVASSNSHKDTSSSSSSSDEKKKKRPKVKKKQRKGSDIIVPEEEPNEVSIMIPTIQEPTPPTSPATSASPSPSPSPPSPLSPEKKSTENEGDEKLDAYGREDINKLPTKEAVSREREFRPEPKLDEPEEDAASDRSQSPPPKDEKLDAYGRKDINKLPTKEAVSRERQFRPEPKEDDENLDAYGRKDINELPTKEATSRQRQFRPEPKDEEEQQLDAYGRKDINKLPTKEATSRVRQFRPETDDLEARGGAVKVAESGSGRRSTIRRKVIKRKKKSQKGSSLLAPGGADDTGSVAGQSDDGTHSALSDDEHRDAPTEEEEERETIQPDEAPWLNPKAQLEKLRDKPREEIPLQDTYPCEYFDRYQKRRFDRLCYEIDEMYDRLKQANEFLDSVEEMVDEIQDDTQNLEEETTQKLEDLKDEQERARDREEVAEEKKEKTLSEVVALRAKAKDMGQLQTVPAKVEETQKTIEEKQNLAEELKKQREDLDQEKKNVVAETEPLKKFTRKAMEREIQLAQEHNKRRKDEYNKILENINIGRAGIPKALAIFTLIKLARRGLSRALVRKQHRVRDLQTEVNEDERELTDWISSLNRKIRKKREEKLARETFWKEREQDVRDAHARQMELLRERMNITRTNLRHMEDRVGQTEQEFEIQLANEDNLWELLWKTKEKVQQKRLICPLCKLDSSGTKGWRMADKYGLYDLKNPDQSPHRRDEIFRKINGQPALSVGGGFVSLKKFIDLYGLDEARRLLHARQRDALSRVINTERSSDWNELEKYGPHPSVLPGAPPPLESDLPIYPTDMKAGHEAKTNSLYRMHTGMRVRQPPPDVSIFEIPDRQAKARATNNSASKAGNAKPKTELKITVGGGTVLKSTQVR